MSVKNSNSKLNKAILAAIEKGYTVDKEGVVRNSSGRIRSLDRTTDRPMDANSPYTRKGYKYFKINIEGDRVHVYVHRLVAYLKFGDKSFSLHTRHLDNDQTNNSWDNIAIGTASDNYHDLPEDFRQERAEKGAAAQRKMTIEKLDYALKERAKGRTQSDIAIEIGVASSTLSYALRGITNKKLQDDRVLDHP